MAEETPLKAPPMSAAAIARELQDIRQQSVLATRAGNYRKVAELSVRAAWLNHKLKEAEANESSASAPHG